MWRSMQKARRGQLERHPSASGVSLSRGGASTASEHGVAACHLCGQSEREAHGLPFTDWLGTADSQCKCNSAQNQKPWPASGMESDQPGGRNPMTYQHLTLEE